MIDITFVPGITPITATWLNEANDTLVGLGTSAGASTIGCVPVGTVSATNMQAAIAQLSAGNYTDAQTRATVLTGLVTTSAASVTAADSVLTAIGKLQKRTNDLLVAKNASGGYAGLSGWNIQLLSTTGTNVSHLQQTNTTNRVYTFPDKDGIVAMTSDTSMVLLATTTVSSAVASVDFLNLFSSSYNSYKVVIEGMTGSTTASPYVRFAVGGVVNSGNNYSAALTSTAAGATIIAFNVLGSVQNGSTGMNAELTIANVNSTVSFKSLYFTSTVLAAVTPTFTGTTGQALFNSLSVVSGFQLYMNTGTVDRAVIRVYGIKNT